MKCIIAGSRHITDKYLVHKAIEACPWQGSITEVVCGGASGVDNIGWRWAAAQAITVHHMRADWATYGKAAGPIRNHQMANYADALILIWDGKSKGSADMKRWAEYMQLRIYEHIVST